MAYSQIIKKMLIAALFTAACITAQAQGIFIYSSYMSIPQASTPTFSPVAGSYSGTQTVTISASTGGVICYNTTGSPATNGTTGCTTGTLYTGTVSVASTETLHAVAGGTGYMDSAVGSAAYTISGGGHSFALVHSPTLCGTASSFVNPITCTIPSTVAGNSVLIFYSFNSGAALPTSYSPAATCVPTPGNGNVSGYAFTGLCIISNVSGGVTSVSIIPSNNYTSSSVMAVEVSGLVTSSPVDTSVGVISALTNYAGASSTGSVTPSNANDVIIGYAGEQRTGSVSVGSGFTVIGESSVYSNNLIWAEYEVVSSTGTYAGNIVQNANFAIYNSGTVALKLQ